MDNLIIIAVFLFLFIDLFVNYSTWKDEAKFPSLNQRTICEYKNKCWRSIVPLFLIMAYVIYA